MIRKGLQYSSVPFLRLLIPLFIGEGVQRCWPAISPVHILSILFGLVAFLIIFRKLSFKGQSYWGVVFFISVFCIGFLRSIQSTAYFPVLPKQQYFTILDDYPLEKEKTFQVVCQIAETNYRVIAYLSKSKSIMDAEPGDVLFFDGLPEIVQNDGNPFEFDYRNYLNNKDIGYRIFLKESQFAILKGARQLDLSRQALIGRKNLIENLHQSGIIKESVDLIASISFGARDEVDKETIKSFTNTGVIHVLAVSGMNVGLIFIILDFFLRFLKSFRSGSVLYTLIILIGIWSYALLTGMSASILRAAMMFTFVLIGTILRRKTSIFNSLAVSAFLLLVWDPSLITDVGFQLSYAAVLAIVVIQPIIYKQLFFKIWIIDKLWMMISVTFAAQLGTLPFTLNYFHQFPVYFWLANIIVIPLVTLILYLSFAVVFLHYVSGFLASALGFILDWAVRLVIFTVNFVEDLPWAVWRGLYPSLLQTFLASVLLILIFQFVHKKKASIVYGVFCSAILLFVTFSVSEYKQLTRSEIIFFNLPETRAMAFATGRDVVILYDRQQVNERLMHSLNPYLVERRYRNVEIFRITDSLHIERPYMSISGSFIFFMGTRIYIQPLYGDNLKNIVPSLIRDVVWLKDAKEIDNLGSILQFTKVLLFHRSETKLKEFVHNQSFSAVEVNQAVQLKFSRSLFLNKEWINLSYFGDRVVRRFNL
jgi:competence protein ComEC